MRHLLIDGDVLVYASAFGAQKARYSLDVEGEDIRQFDNAADCTAYIKAKELTPEQWTRNKHVDVLPESAAISCCKNMLASVKEAVKHDHCTIFLTGKRVKNFREEIATLAPYKGNRVAEKPVHYELATNYYLNLPNVIVAQGEEADDLLGIHSTEIGDGAIIASIDKDLRMIPGKHYEWNNKKKFTVSDDDADRWFWMQMLMGDRADNIPGIKGIGPVAALAAFENAPDRQSRSGVIEQEYRMHYGVKWLEAANEVGKLLWMRRKPNEWWDFVTYSDSKELGVRPNGS